MRLFVASLAFVVLFIGVKALTKISCESSGDNSYQKCVVENGTKLVESIKMLKELSDPPKCVEGETFRIGPDDRSIVVTNGCGAVFAYRAITYSNSCGARGNKLLQFNRRGREHFGLPCKYHAVRQKCGPYYFRVTPGNIYRHPKYRLDTVSLGIYKDNGDYWEGFTTNKMAVEFFNGYSKELFNKKEGNLETKDLLVYGKDEYNTWVEDVDSKIFRLKFMPSDLYSRVLTDSYFWWACFDQHFLPDPFLGQICGGWRTTEVEDRMKELGLADGHQVIIYETLMRNDTEQTDEACIAAGEIFSKNCTVERRKQALLTCPGILTKNRNTKCIALYARPMDAFADCLKWVCSGFKDEEACSNVGNAIDMCPPVVQGNLTDLVKGANCTTDYIPIVQ